MKHAIALKFDEKPVCELMRRWSPKKEETQKQAMQKLTKLGVLELSFLPWATNDVFVCEIDGRTCVISDFRRMEDLNETDSYPVENMRDTLVRKGSEQLFSVFDLKEKISRYNYTLHKEDARRYGQCLSVCSINISRKYPRNLCAHS